MKNTILLLTLLFSVDAFAFENPCNDGNCTIKQIEDVNRANYKTHEQLMQEADDWEAEHLRKFIEEHREAQARADAAPKASMCPVGNIGRVCKRFLNKQRGYLVMMLQST